MFKILSDPEKGSVLEVLDDMIADDLEEYFRDERYVHYERQPEAHCVRFYFGEAGCEKAVDDLVQAFVKWRESR